MNLRNRKKTEGDVVGALQARIRQAQALAAIPEQELLANPRLNPETRATADRLQAERLATGLEMEHRRELRSVRETDRREEERIRAAAAVDAARAATDESYTVVDLVRSRTRFSRLCLGASVVLSVGSAMGLEAAVVAHYPDAPDGIGYLAEVALTGMSTTAIIWAGKLARAGVVPTGAARTALIALIAVPLLVSIVGSTIGSGPVGAIASLGAAAFSAMAYLVATTSATAISALVGRIDARAGHTAAPVNSEPLPRRSDRDALAVVGDAIAEEAADYLRREARRRGDDGGHRPVVPPGDDGATGALPSGGGKEGVPRGRCGGALEDASRRRSQAAAERVRDYFAGHPGATVKGAAKALGMDPKTVRKYRGAS